MSLGGPSQTITQSAPEYQLPYIADLYRMGQQIAYTPYTPYQMPRTAETAGTYQQGAEAMQAIGKSPGLLGQITVNGKPTGVMEAYRPFQQSGLLGTVNVGGKQTGVMEAYMPFEQPGLLDQTQYGGRNMGALEAYMSPFQQSVTDVAKKAAERDYQQGLNTLRASAAQRGAFGGTRHALAENEMMRNLGTQLSNIQMEGGARAFDRASQLYQQDFGNRALKAQMAAGLYQQDIENLQNQAKMASGLYQQDLANQMQKAQSLQQLGLQDEARRQRDLDLAYQEFEKQRLYPLERADAYRALVFGQPQPASRQDYAQPPNPFVQTLGLASLLYGGMGR